MLQVGDGAYEGRVSIEGGRFDDLLQVILLLLRHVLLNDAVPALLITRSAKHRLGGGPQSQEKDNDCDLHGWSGCVCVNKFEE